MKVLITGIAGFAGSHLAETRPARGRGGGGDRSCRAPRPTTSPRVQKDVATVDCDLTEPGAAGQVLRPRGPTVCSTWPGRRWSAPRGPLRADVSPGRTSRRRTSSARGCAGIRCRASSSPRARCTASVPEDEQPISEARRWAPGSPYALSKASQELYAGYYARSEGLPLVIARAFNHVGPRQGLGFVWSDVARQIAQIEKGEVPRSSRSARRRLGATSPTCATWSQAYWRLLGRGEPGRTYNAASGKGDVDPGSHRCVPARAHRPIEMRQVPERVRPVDVPMLVGDASRLRTLTGWAPAISLRPKHRGRAGGLAPSHADGRPERQSRRSCRTPG